MEDSLIFDLLFKGHIFDYREKLEKEENDAIYKSLSEARAKVEKALDEEQLKLVDNYVYHFNMRKDELEFMTGIRILNYGVKIGMELQKAFDNIDELE
ncbi:MAG: hypothetical protein K2L67_01765 [Clostridia bacterium]|nr:hypothetical protein [Clostridia bacterium]